LSKSSFYHGERAALQLAVRIGAELLPIVDRDGVAVARIMGFTVTGTLGILDLAAHTAA
jgi:predicted nucleic acid-binding protein